MMEKPRRCLCPEMGLVLLVIACAIGCSDCHAKWGSYEFDDVTQINAPNPQEVEEEEPGEKAPSDTQKSDEEIVLEEMEKEDPSAIAELIRELLVDEESDEGDETSEIRGSVYGPVLDVPTAHEVWRLSSSRCRKKLRRAGVKFEQPKFATTRVETPVLLTGPVSGVDIAPRWPKSNKTTNVMDCRLVLGLKVLAEYAKTLGVERILYYSSYRPIKPLPKKCKRPKPNRRCKRLKKAFRRASKNPTQHRKALAIDIRWFVLKSGEWIDVKEHYDRRDGVPPCDYTAKTDSGRLLQDLACTLHRNQVFNVILTPNANPAHHDHFHLDITPKAEWYIVR